jgi:hypothetical protein
MKRTNLFSIVMAMAIFLTAFQSMAQEEKNKIKLGLTYTQINDDVPLLKCTAKTKVGKRFEPVQGIEIKVSFGEETPEGFIANIKTDHEGIASIVLPNQVAAHLDSLSPFKFIASVLPNDQFDETTSEIEITRTHIDLLLNEVDSTKTIEAKVFALTDGKWIGAPDTEVKLFIKRLFSDLPIGEDTHTTDETGAITSDFTTSIPGDANGNLIIGAKIEDSDAYGTIIVMKTIHWGIPLKEDDSFYERTLWASRDKTPWWLLIFPNIIIATVWGFIFYLLYLIRKIRKAGTETI